MKSKKRVIVVATSSLTRGGITSVIKAHQSSVFWKEWNCIWIETHVDKSAFTKLFYFTKSLFRYFFLLKNSSLIHCHLSGPFSAFRKLFFLVPAKLLSVPIIIHFHAFSEKSNIPKSYAKFYKFIFFFADKIVVLSENWKKGILNDFNYSKNKVLVIYNPCPKIIKKPTLKKKKLILYAGTLNRRKGFEDLIIAFSKIANKFPDWKLVFAGNGEIEEGKSLAKKFNIYNQVIFKGWVLDKEKHKLFSQASIFCLPSNQNE